MATQFVFNDRTQAGELLAEQLTAYANKKDVLVLGLLRGGVPVATTIAQNLNVELDVLPVRKLGVPGHEELAMGAITLGDTCCFNENIIQELHIAENSVQQVIAAEKKILEQRNKQYHPQKLLPKLMGKTVILVDDGIATGATMQVAMNAVKKAHAKKIIVAVPVITSSLVKTFKKQADALYAVLEPEILGGVGAWYRDFHQVSNKEIQTILSQRTEQTVRDSY